MLSTRQKMIAGAVDLISRRGVHATSLREVVLHTGTPRGSLAHHFPGGKQQMLEEALQFAEESVAAPLELLLRQRGAVEGLRAFGAWWGRILEASLFEAGCPVLAVAIDTGSTPDDSTESAVTDRASLRGRVVKAFVRWQTILAEALVRDGVAPQRAARLAVLAVAAIEGTVAMCRASRSTSPLDDVLAELTVLYKGALTRS